MNIIFEPLNFSHFPLLLTWLESSHVKKWWDQDIVYTLDLIEKKFGSYVKGYKSIKGVNKPISAYIICIGNHPIGYIQCYNAYDFPRSKNLIGLPENLGAMDVFLGDKKYLGKNIGTAAIKLFTDQYILSKYKYVFSDPCCENETAIKALEKAGFVIFKRVDEVFWMILSKKIVRLSIKDAIALELAFRRFFLKNDKLWVFGSRANLQKKGGDIDLYIETKAASVDAAVEMKHQFLFALKNIIGEQKIDVVLNMLNFSHPLKIYEVARVEGVRII